MKGIVFNLLEEVVAQEHGEQTWDMLLDAAGLQGAYTSLGSYSDGELLALVAAASGALNLPADDVVRWFGRQAMPLLAKRYPHFFQPHRTLVSFLLTLNEILHQEVRKLYPGADVPVFEFRMPAEDTLELRYCSRRRLCALAEGFIQGAAGLFGDSVSIEQPKCMNRGDDHCLLVCQSSSQAAAAGRVA